MIDAQYLSQLEQQYGLPKGLLAAQMETESGGDSGAVSPKGALGAFQFLPDTAKQYGIDPLDPQQAAQGAARMNSELLQKYNGDLPSALAAYNWGQGNLDRKGLDKAPEETRNYISKIMAGLNSPDQSGGRLWESEGERKSVTPIPWGIPGGEKPQQDTSALSSIMNGIGNFIAPSAQAKESDVPPGFVPEDQAPSPQQQVAGDVQQETQNNAQQGYNGDIGASPLLPANQQVQSQPLSKDGDIPPGFVPEDQAPSALQQIHNSMSGNAQQSMGPQGPGYGIPATLTAYAANAMQAIPFSDEAGSALAALAGAGKGDTFGARYANLQQAQQAMREAGKQNSPAGTAIGQVGATLATLPGAAKLLPSTEASSVLGAIGKGAASGAAYGGVSGYGEGNAFQTDQQSSDTRASNAGTGALIGGALGGAVGGVGAIAQKILDKPLVTASQDLKAQAQDAYQEAAQNGGTLTPQFTDKFIAKAQSLTPQTTAGKIVSGENEVTKLVNRMQALKGKPISLNEAQEIDEALGETIDGLDNGRGGLNKLGKKLYDVQTSFRQMIENAGPSDISGGKEGFEALKQARQLWSKSIKAQDIERIIARGQSMDNPATSIRSGFRTLLNNPNRIKAFNGQERALIKTAGKANLGQEALRAIGSRLLSISATGAGYLGGGIPGAIASNVASTAIGAGARKLAGSMQASQGQKVIDAVLGNTKTYSVSKPLIAGATQGILTQKRKK